LANQYKNLNQVVIQDHRMALHLEKNLWTSRLSYKKYFNKIEN